MKIAVYAISKNEEQFVERFCQSAKEADYILIADTGSTDNTVALATKYGALVRKIYVNPWRFDIARDTALCLVPEDIDICISLDLDEILENGWREEIESVWKENTTRLRYKFDWGCGLQFYSEKIHHRKGYHWHHPVHEYPRPDLRTNEIYAHTDKLLISHHADVTKSRSQYLDLLKLAVTEDKECPRNSFYYARELVFYNKWIDGIVALKKYLENPKATWNNERCYAMRLLGKCYLSLNDLETAVEWYEKASKEAPNTREPWYELSAIYYRKQDWQKCYTSAKKCLSIVNKELVYTHDPEVWGYRPHDLLAISAYYLGLKDECKTHGQLALDLNPTDNRLITNLEFYNE